MTFLTLTSRCDAWLREGGGGCWSCIERPSHIHLSPPAPSTSSAAAVAGTPSLSFPLSLFCSLRCPMLCILVPRPAHPLLHRILLHLHLHLPSEEDRESRYRRTHRPLLRNVLTAKQTADTLQFYALSFVSGVARPKLLRSKRAGYLRPATSKSQLQKRSPEFGAPPPPCLQIF